MYKLGARGRQQQRESNKMPAPQKNTRLRLFCECYRLSSLTTSFRFMPPYFFPINKTIITDEKASKNIKGRTENRTSHYYSREKDYGITCKIHCHLRMHTTKLAKENRSSSVTHWRCVWCVMRCHSRQHEVVVPLTLTRIYQQR